MADLTISRGDARAFYTTAGVILDRAERTEGRAKAAALTALAAAPGETILHVGVGTGLEHAAILRTVTPGGTLIGFDLTRRMLELTRLRADTPLCEGDATRLPFAGARFDGIFSAYTLDLIPGDEIPLVLAEFRRALRPGGRLVLTSLTAGVDLPSRLFIAWWKLVYRIDPRRLGGCRPLRLSDALHLAGFSVERQVIVQGGFPSEVLRCKLAHDAPPGSDFDVTMGRAKR